MMSIITVSALLLGVAQLNRAASVPLPIGLGENPAEPFVFPAPNGANASVPLPIELGDIPAELKIDTFDFPDPNGEEAQAEDGVVFSPCTARVDREIVSNLTTDVGRVSQQVQVFAIAVQSSVAMLQRLANKSVEQQTEIQQLQTDVSDLQFSVGSLTTQDLTQTQSFQNLETQLQSVQSSIDQENVRSFNNDLRITSLEAQLQLAETASNPPSP